MQVTIEGLKKSRRTSEATLAKLRKEVSTIKDDLFLIGFDILKEQDKLAERISKLETRAGRHRKSERPPNDSIE